MEEKLIEAVRQRKLLYDTSHSGYVKYKLKSKVWNEIAKEAGMKDGKLIILFDLKRMQRNNNMKCTHSSCLSLIFM